MSQSPAPPAPAADDPLPYREPSTPPDTNSTAAEAWISIAIGVILLFLSPRIWQYLASPGTFVQKWTFNDASGNPLAYPKTVFFWGDLAITAFALVLIIEGLVLAFARKPALVLIALVFTVLTVALNLVYVVAMMAQGYGLQILSALAVAFGVYIAMFEWRLLGALRRTP